MSGEEHLRAALPDLPEGGPDAASIRRDYRRETTHSMKHRVDMTAALFAAFVGLAVLVDIGVNPSHARLGFWIYSAEVGLALLAVVAIRAPWTRDRMSLVAAWMGSGLAALMNVYYTFLPLTPELEALGLVCLVTVFAVLVPVGWPVQATISAVALVGFGVVVRNLPFAETASSWVGLAAGAVTSTIGAAFLDRYRYEAFSRSALLEMLSTHAQKDARISAAIAHVTATLHASTGHTRVYETVCRLSRAILECDWSSTFVFDEAADVYRLGASSGVRPEVATELGSVDFPASSLPLFREFRPGELVEIRNADRQSLVPMGLMRRFETASALYVPIWRGRTVIGVLVNGYRQRTGPFSEAQRRIALGIGSAAAIALDNERLVHDLKAASQAKSEFVSTMSHELRTPLNVIGGYVEMLVDPDNGTLTPEQLDYARRINRNASSLLELIESTLKLGRLDAGRDPVQPEWLRLSDLFAQLAEENEERAQSAGVTIEWRQTGLATDAVRVDRGKLKLVLQNLVGNAIKFAPKGRIEVAASGAEGSLTIAVRDTGVGISAEQVQSIFEMFHQLDSSVPGVGLGLHIVKRVVERLAGHVSVESEQGCGTCFTVSLPAEFETRCLADAI